MKCKKYECYNDIVGMTVVWEEAWTDEGELKWRSILGFYEGHPNGTFKIGKTNRLLEGCVTEFFNCK